MTALEAKVHYDYQMFVADGVRWSLRLLRVENRRSSYRLFCRLEGGDECSNICIDVRSPRARKPESVLRALADALNIGWRPQADVAFVLPD